MNERNHSKMHRLIQRSADIRLTPSQQQTLEAHLAVCAECRAYRDELRVLETQLASVSVIRLVPPKSRATAQQVAAIQTSYRRHTMKKQILSTAGVLVTIALVAVLILLAGRIIPRQSSPAVAPMATALDETPTAAIPTDTPQSQPLRYFTRAESDTRPVETPVPGADTNPNSGLNSVENLSIAEAEQLAGFDVLEPNWLPDSLIFVSATFWPEQHIVQIIYDYYINDPGGSNKVVLDEQPIPENSEDCIDYWIACSMLVGASATIEEVQIGDIPGEYVGSGVWQAIGNTGQWGWDTTPPIQKLRWRANGVALALSTINVGVSKQDLIAMAESLSPASQATAEKIAAVEAQVGYTPKSLTSLPTGYVFSRAEVNQPTNSVCLVYEYTGNDGPGPELRLAQGPSASVPGLAANPDAFETRRTPATVGGASEAYVLSGMQRDGEWACVPSQSGSSPALLLTWQADGQQFDLYAMGGKCMAAEGLTELDVLRLAEETTGISTHTADELDPECSSDLAAVEKLAGFQALLPQSVPDGMEFYGASYNGAQSMIGLYYKRTDSNHTGLAIYQMPVQPELGHDLASKTLDLPADGYKFLTVADTTAVMILGDWAFNEQGGKIWFQTPGLAPTLWFERDGLLICISAPWLADSASDPQVALIAIAEGIK